MGINLIEINTARYTEEFGQASAASELDLIRQMTAAASERSMVVAAGHGLNLENLPQLLEIPRIEELNIGHSIVARSVFVGLGAAVKELLALMPADAPPHPTRGAADGD
jgi:pyridoxine 5-phosphate synthase